MTMRFKPWFDVFQVFRRKVIENADFSFTGYERIDDVAALGLTPPVSSAL